MVELLARYCTYNNIGYSFIRIGIQYRLADERIVESPISLRLRSQKRVYSYVVPDNER